MKARKPALHIQRATRRERSFYHQTSEWPTLWEFIGFVAQVAAVGAMVYAVVRIVS